jgi:ubiquinone/menaquinone biosynthesis C-methylase UbiE
VRHPKPAYPSGHAELRASYDRSAAGYDGRFEALQAVKYDAVLARLDLPWPARVLDLGAGTGLLLRRLEGELGQEQRRPPPLALDFSRPMLARCPAWAHRVQADALRLPLEDACCDLVFAITSLILPARVLPRALLEIARVLRPGGTLALTLLAADVYPGLIDDLRACGLAPGPEFPCGQDLGWVCVRHDPTQPNPPS